MRWLPPSDAKRDRPLPAAALTAAALVAASGCSTPAKTSVEPLMPTPLIYQVSERGPLDHIPEKERWKLRIVYYITVRERDPDLRTINYGNEEADVVSAGVALIGFGGYDMSWSDLSEVSSAATRDQEVPLSIAGLLEAAQWRINPVDPTGRGIPVKRMPEFENLTETAAQRSGSEESTRWLLRQFQQDIEDARDKDVLIYVHGAKVDFYNACAFAAQLDHFMGRDMTSIAFSWPSRQNILAYASGKDVQRALRSAPALARIIRVIAEETDARRINIVSWSAGGRVVTEALELLHDRLPGASEADFREAYRLGTVYYAASDVPRDEFIEVLPKLDAMVNELVVTGSANDGALKTAALVMGGETRLGQIDRDNPITEEQRAVVRATDRLAYVDMSYGSAKRGFDITGHRYWIDHPWANTDMILAVRTDLPPSERGLDPGDSHIHWVIPEDYPERIQRIVERLQAGRPENAED